MGECLFWYRPTRVVPDQRPLNGRCCCCGLRLGAEMCCTKKPAEPMAVSFGSKLLLVHRTLYLIGPRALTRRSTFKGDCVYQLNIGTMKNWVCGGNASLCHVIWTLAGVTDCCRRQWRWCIGVGHGWPGCCSCQQHCRQ